MSDLQTGAQNAICDCLQVQSTDRVVIVSDEATWEIGQALFDEVSKVTDAVRILKIENYGARPLKDFPSQLRQDIEGFSPTVSIYAAQGQAGELENFRFKLIDLLHHRFRCRHAHMINITREIMRDGMSVDHNLLYEITQKVYELVCGAREIKVASKKGTDFIAKFDPQLKWISSHGKIRHGEPWQNLPGTETYTCPADVNGMVVAEVVGDFFSEKYGYLKVPLTVHIRDGYVWEVESENKELEQEFKEYIFTSPLGNRVGEFAIGTNVGLTHFIGNLLQDEKFPGVHLAFGHPYPKETGANWDSPRHVDIIPTEVDIWVDGKQIMKDGKFVIE
ncbi:MAG: aminopeptidase [Anaerolineae bacterium]